MNKRFFVVASTMVLCACSSALKAMADSEFASMTAETNHLSSSVDKLGDTSSTSMSSGSGIFGAQGSSDGGWATRTNSNIESSGASGALSPSIGGPLMIQGQSQSNMRSGGNFDNHGNGRPLSTSPATGRMPEKQDSPISVSEPVTSIGSVHWNDHRREDSSYGPLPTGN